MGKEKNRGNREAKKPKATKKPIANTAPLRDQMHVRTPPPKSSDK